MSANTKGAAAAIVSAICFGLMPLISKTIYAAGSNPLTVVFLRFFIAPEDTDAALQFGVSDLLPRRDVDKQMEMVVEDCVRHDNNARKCRGAAYDV